LSLEENKAIILTMCETMNTEDLASRLATMDELLAPDFVEHTQKLEGLESFKQFHTQFTEGFPDINRTIEDVIAEGDKVWIRVKYTGTHTGEFYGVPATYKKITFTSVQIYRMVDGKAVERWSVSDNMDFFRQLGLIEYTEKGKKLFPEGT